MRGPCPQSPIAEVLSEEDIIVPSTGEDRSYFLLGPSKVGPPLTRELPVGRGARDAEDEDVGAILPSFSNGDGLDQREKIMNS